MPIQYSFIVPVFNRPNEIHELLSSFSAMETTIPYEIVIVEDGSTHTSSTVIDEYNNLNIAYYVKPNTGPGDSRNYGMERAKGSYFIILDSDVLLPKMYLNKVHENLVEDYVDCFGGPDAAHKSFSPTQKAINFAMTSFVTTGGLRGGKAAVSKFQPRSFNMGLSKKAFLASKGFGRIHPGEDPDLVFRLWNLGFQTKIFYDAFVYHKRRISWHKFYLQVRKFGMVRPILNVWHPTTQQLAFWFPSLFTLGLVFAIIILLCGFLWPIMLYALYFCIAFCVALAQTKSLSVSILALYAILIQFGAYGFGFLESTLAMQITKNKPEEQFPKLFFKQP